MPNIGQNLFTWVTSNFEWLYLAYLIIGGFISIASKKKTAIFAFIAVAIIGAGLIFLPTEVKDMFLNIFRGLTK
ncbi:hypothetical protein [Carnobacterium maltaromaticum]|uniref:hypothetical protein n=1 Tax=Carnobacterium maltaromaticum TaxID=2751 RepID=UPI00295E4D26|nr:hypothetical protein [Carnobacterium maltaromaticum]